MHDMHSYAPRPFIRYFIRYLIWLRTLWTLQAFWILVAASARQTRFQIIRTTSRGSVGSAPSRFRTVPGNPLQGRSKTSVSVGRLETRLRSFGTGNRALVSSRLHGNVERAAGRLTLSVLQHSLQHRAHALPSEVCEEWWGGWPQGTDRHLPLRKQRRRMIELRRVEIHKWMARRWGICSCVRRRHEHRRHAHHLVDMLDRPFTMRVHVCHHAL